MNPRSRGWIIVAVAAFVVWTGNAMTAAGAGGPWTEDQMLVAAETGESDYFGRAIASDGTTALVGVVYDDEGSYGNAGSVCVFERSGDSWTQVDRLVASDYINSGFFGGSVAMSGDRAVIGAYGVSVKRGAAYNFVRGTSSWSEEQKLIADDPAALDEFGYASAIDGDTVVVGSYRADHSGYIDPGAAYVYTYSGATWNFEQKLVASDPGTDDFFGYKVAVSGDTAAVSSLQHNGTGAVYIFTRSGSVWTEQQKLTGSGGVDDGNFGVDLLLAGDTLVAGASTTDHSGLDNAGAVYVFERSGGTFGEVQRLIASEPQVDGNFGTGVALSGDTLLVGAAGHDLYGVANAGMAYLFTRSGGVWTERQKLMAGEREENARVGFDVALSPDVALAAAPWADVDLVVDAGAMCSYSYTAQLFADGFESGDPSGWSGAIGGR